MEKIKMDLMEDIVVLITSAIMIYDKSKNKKEFIIPSSEELINEYNTNPLINRIVQTVTSHILNEIKNAILIQGTQQLGTIIDESIKKYTTINEIESEMD